ncbi:hypothetical protein DFH09DRAFT_620199 [Mycena vulgaris]|nr:hypothetical protein DFH09DRAFT_620199 [Mycena vulgaris]
MFASSNIQVIEQLSFDIIQVTTLGLDAPDHSTLLRNIPISENLFGRVNYFMSDAIVVWRAWMLWQDNLRIKVLLSLCMFGTLVGITTDMTFVALYLVGNTKFTPTGARTLILVLSLMFTNVVSTTLIGVKVWHYRKQIKDLLALPKNSRTNIERILIILTESGAIYCLIWIPQLYVVLSTTSVDNTGYKITANIVPQLSAIYPVVVVLLVAMEKTHLQTTITGPTSQPIHFVHAPTTVASTASSPLDSLHRPGGLGDGRTRSRQLRT